MDTTPDMPETPRLLSAQEPTEVSLRLWRAAALAGAALVAALVFGAYSQPELLLNFAGLRYCG